jgi:preprotein translocase subunit SecB
MSNGKTKISAEEYQKILSGLDLVSISLKESKCYLNTELKLTNEMNISIHSDETFDVKTYDDIHIIQKYSLIGKLKNSKSKLLQIDLTLLIVLKSKEKFTQEFFNVYKEISLKLNTWPYFREFVNNITARMNIPPLTLPLFKVNIQ